jgi:hypothetical protein
MKTGVEYLVEQLLPKALSEEQYYHIEKAKEMEKEQIINAWDNSTNSGDYRSGKEYYDETFKQQEQCKKN